MTSYKVGQVGYENERLIYENETYGLLEFLNMLVTRIEDLEREADEEYELQRRS